MSEKKVRLTKKGQYASLRAEQKFLKKYISIADPPYKKEKRKRKKK